MMNIDYTTYELIETLLLEGTELEPTYSVEEIAEMTNTSVETVLAVDSSMYE